jgi:ATP-binding cassette subfamily C protein CydC
MAPLGRTLAITRPAAGRLVLTALLGAGAIAADIGLLATAAWLISKAAQHPNEAQLAVAIVGVQFFGLVPRLLPLRGAAGRPRRRLPLARPTSG